MHLVRVGQGDFGCRFNVVPPIDARARGSCPQVVTSGHDLVDPFVLLTYGYRDAFVHLRAIAHVALGDDSRTIGRVEEVQLWIVGKERPHTVVVHGEGVHASSGCHGPYFDRLIGRGGENGVAVVGDQDVPHIVRVSHKLGDALARPRVPYTHDAFWAAARDDRGARGKGIDGALCDVFVVADCDLELLA